MGAVYTAVHGSVKAETMTRQVALGAIVAFSITVLALSLWQPSSDVTATPPAVAPVPVQPVPPPATMAPRVDRMMLRPAAAARPQFLQRQALPVMALDAGTP
jgi:hypothetical protein